MNAPDRDLPHRLPHRLGEVAIIVTDVDASVQFYERLGLEHVMTEANRDDDASVIATMHAGDDTFLHLVGPRPPGSVDLAVAAPGTGGLQYVALAISLEAMEQIWHALSVAGIPASEVIQRGYERLVFVEDPDGVLVTLTAWGVEPDPRIPRWRVLRQAAILREQDGAPHIEDDHIRRAIAEIEAAPDEDR